MNASPPPAPADQQLWRAARDGDLAGVEAALDAGAQVNARGEYGDSALNLAAEYGHLDVVLRLLAAGADIENLGGADKTPLMCAAFAGQVPVARKLLDHGARINHDLMSSLQLKVNILRENAEDGMVLPQAVEVWQGFLDYMIASWKYQQEH